MNQRWFQFCFFSILFLLINCYSGLAQRPARQITISREQFYAGSTQIKSSDNHYYRFGGWHAITTTAAAVDNKVTTVEIEFVDEPGNWISLIFSTANYGGELKTGKYQNIANYLYDVNHDSGRPSLEILDHDQCDYDTSGEFTIIDAEYDLSDPKAPLIIKFAANFEQYCSASPFPIKGTVYFNAQVPTDPSQPRISKISYSKTKKILTITGDNLDETIVVVKDGYELSPPSTKSYIGKTIKFTNVNLTSGEYDFQLANVNGLISDPYTLVVK